MKTFVIITADSPYNEYKKGDMGYIDGYVQGGDGRPCAVVVLTTKRVVLAFPSVLQVIDEADLKYE